MIVRRRQKAGDVRRQLLSADTRLHHNDFELKVSTAMRLHEFVKGAEVTLHESTCSRAAFVSAFQLLEEACGIRVKNRFYRLTANLVYIAHAISGCITSRPFAMEQFYSYSTSLFGEGDEVCNFTAAVVIVYDSSRTRS